jgi:hypothetical protein
LHQDIHDLTSLIDYAPQVRDRSTDSDEYLVDMLTSANPWFVPHQCAGLFGTEFPAPQADRLIADRYASGGKHLFNVPE